MTLLRAIQLKKSFGSVMAADNVSVDITENEVIGIIGANGAGKTSFVNMITGYLKPDSGQILYEGRDITALVSRDITRLGICRSFQVPQVFSSATVFENLLIALGATQPSLGAMLRPLHQEERIREAEVLLERYSLTDYRGQESSLLPQGIRKLMDIAMAVVSHPRLLLLDEPTSGVSADEKFGIMDTIMTALKVTKVTTLFVEHDMEIIGRYAERVLAFYDGGIIADGPPGEVLENDQVRQYVIGEELHRAATDDQGAGHA